jgi:hypothetical protein
MKKPPSDSTKTPACDASSSARRVPARQTAKAGGRASKKPVAATPLGAGLDPVARRRAAVILEVLAGERTAAEAAGLLSVSAMHYYLLERRALQGLVAACAPRPKGPAAAPPEQAVSRLRRELDRSRRECLRQAALVRATQRAIGLPAAATAPAREKEAASGKRPRRRRAAVRALRASQALHQNPSGPPAADVVEQCSSEADGLRSYPHGQAGSSDAVSAGRDAAHGGAGTPAQERADDTHGQEAVGDRPRRPSDRVGGGQAADESAAGDIAR